MCSPPQPSLLLQLARAARPWEICLGTGTGRASNRAGGDRDRAGAGDGGLEGFAWQGGPSARGAGRHEAADGSADGSAAAR